jgi:ATP-dependent RNA helicase DDX28
LIKEILIKKKKKRMLKLLLQNLIKINQTTNRLLHYKPIITENKLVIGEKLSSTIDKRLQKRPLLRDQKKLLISTPIPSFNHYIGQIYPKFDPNKHLLTSNWIKRGSIGKSFTINPIGTHPALSTGQNSETFIDIGVEKELAHRVEHLKQNMKIVNPSIIQSKAFSQICPQPRAHQLLVAETGSGKTLAYVLPIIQNAIQFKSLNIEQRPMQPISIILVPTRELAFQVYSLLGQLTNTLNICIDLHRDIIIAKKKAMFNVERYKNVKKEEKIIYKDDQIQEEEEGEETKESINSINQLNEREIVDILVTVPNQLNKRLKNDQLDGNCLRHLVIDEADTLLDDSFNQELLKSIRKLNLNLKFDPLSTTTTQLIFTSATVPRDMRNILKDIINCENEQELNSIQTERTNHVMTHITQKFIRTSAPERIELLLELVKDELANDKSVRTIMIFSHRTVTATFIWKLLKENQIDADLLTKDTAQRELLVEKFLLNKQRRVFVATDVASRGWDTQHVNHVINFEMPHFIADYIHRCGRVGRIGSHKCGGSGPKVTSFITRAFEVDMVMNIEKAVRLDQHLDNVNANITRILKHKYPDQSIKGQVKVRKTFKKQRSIN